MRRGAVGVLVALSILAVAAPVQAGPQVVTGCVDASAGSACTSSSSAPAARGPEPADLYDDLEGTILDLRDRAVAQLEGPLGAVCLAPDDAGTGRDAPDSVDRSRSPEGRTSEAIELTPGAHALGRVGGCKHAHADADNVKGFHFARDHVDWYVFDAAPETSHRVLFEGVGRCALTVPGSEPWERSPSCVEGIARPDAGPVLVAVSPPSWLHLLGGQDVAFHYGLTVVGPDGQRVVSSLGPVHDEAEGPAGPTVPPGVRTGVSPRDGDRSPAGGDVASARRVPRTGDAGALVPLQVAALAVAAWILYRRLSRDDVLDHDVRSRLVELIEDRPGIRPTELADRLDTHLTTVLYHLRILEEVDAVVLADAARGNRCFVPGQGRPDPALEDALRSRAKRRLIELLAREPGLSMAEAGRRLDRDRSTVKYHVDGLAEAGLLRTWREAGTRRMEATGRALAGLSAD